MVYSQFVEVGRLVLVSFGPHADKLAVITDIVDDKRVMIDLVESTEPREMIPVKRLRLTDIKIEIERGAAAEEVAKVIKSQNVVAEWEKTKWAQHIKKGHARAALNDFQRFKYEKLAEKRDAIVRTELAKH